MAATRIALVVAEKPSIAKELARILDPNPVRENTNARYNCIWRLAPRDINNVPHTVLITSVAGHLKDYSFGNADKWCMHPNKGTKKKEKERKRKKKKERKKERNP